MTGAYLTRLAGVGVGLQASGRCRPGEKSRKPDA
jgi:hypothetical protein